MKSGYLIHIVAVATLMLGVWIYISNSETNQQEEISKNSKIVAFPKSPPKFGNSAEDERHIKLSSGVPTEASKRSQAELNVKGNSELQTVNPSEVINDYMAAWENKDKAKLDKLWALISDCEKCLLAFVDLIVDQKIEEGMLLGVAIKMAALDTDIVLPVFDALIVPTGNKSTAIILSEKVINNGRPEFVTKIFDVIYRAQESGYQDFARQLTWVISKLDNMQGLEPILDTIIGRRLTSPEYASHVSSVFSKVVQRIPDSPEVGKVVADYYLQANSQEQDSLWQVASQHGETLVSLAVDADKNGQNYNVQKYSTAISQLPNLKAVDSLMQLHVAVDYSPGYLSGMLAENVAKNPTIKVLHKLEDYMRDPHVKLESRIFAAEGLLAVRNNRQARYILQKVIDSTQDPDSELQAYIGGRL